MNLRDYTLLAIDPNEAENLVYTLERSLDRIESEIFDAWSKKLDDRELQSDKRRLQALIADLKPRKVTVTF